jgi:hypothetical protein
MNKIVYISILGSSGDKSPNIGPFQSGLFGLIPQSIESVFTLSNASSEQISTQIISNFPYLKNKVNTVEIDIFDYEDVLENVLKIQSQFHKDDIKFIVNVTGGTKIMTLGAFMGGVLIGADIQYIKQDPENKEEFEVLNIQMPKIPIYKMHNVQKLILYLLKNETNEKSGLTQAQLRKKINQDYIWKKKLNFDVKKQVSAQLMSYHCEILERNDLLNRTHDDKNRRAHILTLTRIGSIIAKFLLSKK